jgi:hypothetical protein
MIAYWIIVLVAVCHLEHGLAIPLLPPPQKSGRQKIRHIILTTRDPWTTIADGPWPSPEGRPALECKYGIGHRSSVIGSFTMKHAVLHFRVLVKVLRQGHGACHDTVTGISALFNACQSLLMCEWRVVLWEHRPIHHGIPHHLLPSNACGVSTGRNCSASRVVFQEI